MTPHSVGSLMGGYKLLGLLGEGGMARVYLAEKVSKEGFDKRVALKVMQPGLSNPFFFNKFVTEARIGARLSHANLVEVMDFFQEGEICIIVMEFVDGPSLSALMERMKRTGQAFPLDITFQLLAEVCKGVLYAHSATDSAGKPLHLIHRDLKPGNILVSGSGKVKVADFGIAKADSIAAEHTQDTHGMRGTHRYMSPQQAEGIIAIDQRSDLFSLGLILFEMITLEPLYNAPSANLALVQAVQADVEPRLAAIPEGPARTRIRAFLRRALARSPQDRFPSALEMLEELDALRVSLAEPHNLLRWLKEHCWAVQDSLRPLGGGLSAADETMRSNNSFLLSLHENTSLANTSEPPFGGLSLEGLAPPSSPSPSLPAQGSAPPPAAGANTGEAAPAAVQAPAPPSVGIAQGAPPQEEAPPLRPLLIAAGAALAVALVALSVLQGTAHQGDRQAGGALQSPEAPGEEPGRGASPSPPAATPAAPREGSRSPKGGASDLTSRATTARAVSQDPLPQFFKHEPNAASAPAVINLTLEAIPPDTPIGLDGSELSMGPLVRPLTVGTQHVAVFDCGLRRRSKKFTIEAPADPSGGSLSEKTMTFDCARGDWRPAAP